MEARLVELLRDYQAGRFTTLGGFVAEFRVAPLDSHAQAHPDRITAAPRRPRDSSPLMGRAYIVPFRPRCRLQGRWAMTAKRESALRIALVFVGAICLALGPLMLVWPAGWRWTPHHAHYEQMMVGIYFTLGIFLIRASKDPLRHLSIIWFAVWSSIVHASIMTIQALTDSEHRGHLLADVPALFLAAAALSLLMPRRQRPIPSLPVQST